MNVLGGLHDRLLKNKTSTDRKRHKNRQNVNCAAEFKKDVTESPRTPLLTLQVTEFELHLRHDEIPVLRRRDRVIMELAMEWTNNKEMLKAIARVRDF